jgi:hypothetical protein
LYDLEPFLPDEEEEPCGRKGASYMEMSLTRERQDAAPFMLDPVGALSPELQCG